MTEKELNKIAEMVLKKLDYLNKQYFTANEAANYLGLAIQTVYKLVSDKRIKARKPNGKVLIFDRSELDKYLNSNKQ